MDLYSKYFTEIRQSLLYNLCMYIVNRNNNINYNIEDFQKDKMKKLENYKSNDLYEFNLQIIII